MKRYKTILCIIVCLVLVCTFTNKVNGSTGGYGVFVGLSGKDYRKACGYDIVVIDPDNFTEKELSALKERSRKVYGYLNIGSVETFRDYYKSIKSAALDPYPGYPDEYFADVSNTKWQGLIKKRATEWKRRGVDGYFIDNIDVYDEYKSEKNFDAIWSILSTIRKSGLPIMLNGGITFVNKCLHEGKDIKGLISAVNLEEVYTAIDFDNNKLIKSDSEDRATKIRFLKKMAGLGIKPYITEYTKDKAYRKKISKLAKKEGFTAYITDDIHLR